MLVNFWGKCQIAHTQIFQSPIRLQITAIQKSCISAMFQIATTRQLFPTGFTNFLHLGNTKDWKFG